jgi:hypothetical protein
MAGVGNRVMGASPELEKVYGHEALSVSAVKM